jgi:hypothetical protein
MSRNQFWAKKNPQENAICIFSLFSCSFSEWMYRINRLHSIPQEGSLALSIVRKVSDYISLSFSLSALLFSLSPLSFSLSALLFSLSLSSLFLSLSLLYLYLSLLTLSLLSLLFSSLPIFSSLSSLLSHALFLQKNKSNSLYLGLCWYSNKKQHFWSCSFTLS